MSVYFQSDAVQIVCADCVTFLRDLPADAVDMTLTSPPYDHLREYEGQSEFDTMALIVELLRVTKPGGVVIWNVADATVNGDETGTSMQQALLFKSLGFRLHDTMIYHKRNPLPASSSAKRYHQAWEYMFCFSRGDPKTFNPLMVDAKYGYLPTAASTRRSSTGTREYAVVPRNKTTRVQNVFSYPIGGGITTRDKLAFQHPALMPEALARDQIATWTNVGDLVIDPFLGAGTTAKMSVLAGRRCIGGEISESYCAIATARLRHTLGLFYGS